MGNTRIDGRMGRFDVAHTKLKLSSFRLVFFF